MEHCEYLEWVLASNVWALICGHFQSCANQKVTHNQSFYRDVCKHLQYVLTLNVLATLEDALGEGASRCLPRACLAFTICSMAYALALVSKRFAHDYDRGCTEVV
jgi:hypothetical protein